MQVFIRKFHGGIFEKEVTTFLERGYRAVPGTFVVDCSGGERQYMVFLEKEEETHADPDSKT